MVKLVGDVRVTWCNSFDDYLQSMLADDHFASIIVELSEAEGIDSTTLGLLAKISIESQRQFQYIPTIYSPNESITRLLESMGFDSVFHIVRSAGGLWQDSAELLDCDSNDEQTLAKVIEAHRLLMGLNEDNRLKFEELVATLEASVAR